MCFSPYLGVCVGGGGGGSQGVCGTTCSCSFTASAAQEWLSLSPLRDALPKAIEFLQGVEADLHFDTMVLIFGAIPLSQGGGGASFHDYPPPLGGNRPDNGGRLQGGGGIELEPSPPPHNETEYEVFAMKQVQGHGGHEVHWRRT